MELHHLTELLEQSSYSQRRKGQAINTYRDKASLSLIRSGYIKRYMITNEGSVGTQSIYGPGYFFPLTSALLALLDQHIYEGDETYFYESLTDVQMYTIDGDTLRKAAEANPLIYKDVLFEAGRRMQSNILLLENTSLKSALHRVAHELVCLATSFGNLKGEAIVLKVPLTHQDIGDILNLNRETVSRAMGKLQDSRIIHIEDRRIIIPDIEALKAIYQ